MHFTNKTIQYKRALYDYVANLSIPNINVNNSDLLLQSFIHKSYACDYGSDFAHNERLEFLGDWILGALVNKFIFLHFPKSQESILTLYKVKLVREKTLAIIAKNIQLDNHIFLSNGEEKQWWRKKDSVLSDCLEAFIGYLYLDQDINIVESFVNMYICSQIDKIQIATKSYKSQLQEYVQKIYKQLPLYQTKEDSFDKYKNPIIYKSRIFIDNKSIAIWYGKNKKSAEEDGAQKAVEKLYRDNNYTI